MSTCKTVKQKKLLQLIRKQLLLKNEISEIKK